jgi:hypothetical protein
MQFSTLQFCTHAQHRLCVCSVQVSLLHFSEKILGLLRKLLELSYQRLIVGNGDNIPFAEGVKAAPLGGASLSTICWTPYSVEVSEILVALPFSYQ